MKRITCLLGWHTWEFVSGKLIPNHEDKTLSAVVHESCDCGADRDRKLSGEDAFQIAIHKAIQANDP